MENGEGKSGPEVRCMLAQAIHQWPQIQFRQDDVSGGGDLGCAGIHGHADRRPFKEGNIAAGIAHHHNPENAGDFADFAAITASADLLTQPDDEAFAIDLGIGPSQELCEDFHMLSEKAFLAVGRELGKQMQFFENFIDRMEAFRRPSPVIQEEISRTKGESTIWKMPEKS